jgi:hypothetical protein
MTFGQPELLKGFDFLIAVIGLFGIGEILLTMEEGLAFKGKSAKISSRAVWQHLEEMLQVLEDLPAQHRHRLLDGHHARRRHAGLVHELRHGRRMSKTPSASARATSRA